MRKPKISYILKNIYTLTTSNGTLSTTPSNLSVSSTAQFNQSGGYAFIEVSGLKYEFYYAGISGNNLTGARLLQTGASVNYSANSKVYPIFEIYPENFSDYVLTYEQDRRVQKYIFAGDILDEVLGYYFTAELIYDKITYSEHANYAYLFNKFVDEIYFTPDVLMPVRYKVYIAEPHVIEDFRQIAYKNFRIKFRSLRRYEHGYDESNKWRWGNRVTIFNDRELHSSGLSWYSVMIEQNSKDETTYNNLLTFVNNFNNHLTHSNPHGSLYYTKSEVNSLLRGKMIKCFVSPAGAPPRNDYFENDDGFKGYGFSGISGKITKIAHKGKISSITGISDVSAGNYIFSARDIISLYRNEYYETGNNLLYIQVIKNNAYWFRITVNYGSYNPSEDDLIVSLYIENIS